MERPLRTLLRAEGLAALLLSVLLYSRAGTGWLLFALLLLLPDLSMVGYLRNERLGARLYNLFHSYSLPLALAGAGVLMERRLLVALALIWTAHIGLDRMLGYGLKSSAGFRFTHLGPIGRGAQPADGAGAPPPASTKPRA
jgi:hypothetical protein